MKKTCILLLTILIFSACADKKAEKQAALNEVIKIHDKVMAADGKLEDNKMKLDTLVKLPGLQKTDSAFVVRANLIAADSAMDNWMHNFDYEQKGKSADETITYMAAQKIRIKAVDSMINKAIAESDKYLKTKKK